MTADRRRGQPDESAKAIGFDPEFLSVRLVPPTVVGAAAKDVLKLKSGDTVVNHTHFSLVMSRSRKFARWVAWNLDGLQLKSIGRSSLKFAPDPDVPVNAQIGESLYSKNEFDRGHLARRQDLVWGVPDEAMDANLQSFRYTNIVPHHVKFHQSGKAGLWGELEDAILKEARVEKARLSLMAGPVLQDDDVEYRNCQIPREFWKVIAWVDESTSQMMLKGYILSQADLVNEEVAAAFDLTSFRVWEVPLSEIENRASARIGGTRAQPDEVAAARKAAATLPFREIVTRADVMRP